MQRVVGKTLVGWEVRGRGGVTVWGGWRIDGGLDRVETWTIGTKVEGFDGSHTCLVPGVSERGVT